MDLLNLVAKISIDKSEFEGGLTKLANGAKKAGKIVAAGFGVATTAVAALTKKAIDGFGEYEQLAGGIETLYGKSAGKMMAFADKAFKSAGMSANDYMETAIESSAALIKSLGGDTETAADLMNMSIIDMMDNVNKMGTSLEGIQNAYRGFSRGNFAMLDNLALGYAGTKDGMIELMEDAEKLDSTFKATRDENGNLTMSYEEIVRAIHIVQTNLGIAGTTAKEASSTIQGSINSMTAAWQNLVTGLANGDADIEKLIDDLVISIIGENGEGGVLNNILPAVERALDAIGRLITTAVPTIFPIIVDIIIRNLPAIISAGTEILVALINGLVSALPQLIASIPEIVKAVVGALKNNWPAIKDAGAELLKVLWSGIEGAWKWFSDILSRNFSAIKDNLKESWEQMKKDASDIWEDLKKTVSGVIDAIKGFLDFDFSFPKIPLPHFAIYPPGWSFGDLLKGEIPSLGIEWYKKAYDTPYMFTKPTAVFKGFGDGVGGEMVYGRDNLMRDIDAVVSKHYNSDRPIFITIQSVLDKKVIGESVVKYERDKARAMG